ncbi:hypothetical protein Pmani_023434 [Petrolisthes manimaculis]|uniref:Uncharacterized protein n=1 Tax=Petrolisthes manimaculis TaxID=1843537 RepID=A0AAE1PAJ1_9EUCA|nr:hypothetical protein Pmani_023434 [Petrolisthes manimaculis]
MLATLKKSIIEGLATLPSSSSLLLLLLTDLVLVLECHAAFKESLVVHKDTTLTITELEVDSRSLCECRMMCLTYPPCTAVSFTNQSSVNPTTTTAGDPTPIGYVRTQATTSNGTLSSVKAMCEAEGYTSVTAANFELIPQYLWGKYWTGFMRNNDNVDFADGSSLPWSDVQPILNDKFLSVSINDGNDCFRYESYRKIIQGYCNFPNNDYKVMCVEV